MDITLLFASMVTLASGIPLTLLLTFASLFASLVLSVPLAFMRASPSRWFSLPVLAYTYVFRGTPLLVQLFLIYYGLGQIGIIRSSVLWILLRDPFWCCLLAFSLNGAAYTTEIFRGGIQGVETGMVEAAQALGMSPLQIKRRIIFPLAFRSVLPSYANEVISLVKATSLASTVTLLEITGLSRKLVSETFAPYEIFVAAGLLYLSLTFLLTSFFHALETGLNGASRTVNRRGEVALRQVAHGQ
ncbi:ABC transporter permease subunit [Rhizobium leguminosarum]|uniref:ABC transporter permease n=1 Tax=Rhizobium leguminosarum TaxID=384 RepID=UPI00102FB90F|nr:ABC transporter permease subunit [Rhizobium leguminosarum]TBF87922.1 ABC transporter permease subunit [Rhizobium leguminosarum]TBG07097.1 ABC transporter permease subunit [Rhizobium leguminosarum]TBG07570.1 ABC transporter permease subunit [Rhizobium leguminosarum]TBG30781.1 ABC transporter permease subunit [Rhizobium leguminosarum]TBG50022.1 ABC transporter permease subunit [Rhizobium leguminosarum]